MARVVYLVLLLGLSGCVSNDRATESMKKDSNASFETDVRNQMIGCWNLDVGLPGLEDMAVEVRAEFDPDGSVRSAEFADPATVNSGTAAYMEFAESAVRAVLRCSPIKVPPALPYEEWKTMTFNFSAKDMIQ